ncbi:hypothetical protein [Stenotrophobium rhamnosiphilum]|uniref:Tetratricopeptide repeat protein n=1 Tax=Stenotrophobium rhamnosiphilum TaxID=2029166 RepID=A0A2T5MDL7_9GAMM|nr:hypothetical protein [Stenotrophobium rhamnosiphilum]PTU30663.1 hypothetical protein CJD38_14290 [Stenotrophobium rhamnosiphilum]
MIALSAIWLAYEPGLAGGFLFDDFANLPSLGATGPIDNGPALARYLTSGIADPTGRPITVASFLIDAQNWPADPLSFKRTNLLIHLLNVTLLAFLLLALGRRSGLTDKLAHNAALLGATVWGIHPFFVSTTLYIVQREAMLPVTFTLAALLAWLTGRDRLAKGQLALGIALELTGLGLGTLLATLSKANGALLPFYALLIEHLLLRPRDTQPLPRAHYVVVGLLWLPALAVIGYLIHSAVTLLGVGKPFGRDWTEAQRLLTEPRVMWDYLRLLWLPRPFTTGLFNDQFRVSTSLLQPWTTLPALLGIFALITMAWSLRKRAPLWSLAFLFFFAGHLIESTSVALELYFEHRNYLPALLLFWPLSIWLLAPGKIQHSRIALALVIVCGLGWMTHERAKVWGNTTEQAVLWAKLNPESPRAQSYAAQIMMANNQPQWTQARLRPLLKQAPSEIQIAFNLLGTDCRLGGVPPADLEATRQALLSTRRLGLLSFQWLSDAIVQARNKECSGLTMLAVKSLIDAAWDNPATRNQANWQQDILNLRGQYALAEQQPHSAYQHFSAALLTQVKPAVALEQAATLGSAGQQKLALCQLELWEQQPKEKARIGFSMPSLHEWVLQKQNYWSHEIISLKAALQRDLPTNQRNMNCPTLAPTPVLATIPNAH